MRGIIHSALLLILLAGPASAVVPQTVWQQRFVSEDAELEYKAAAAAADQTLWLALGKRTRGELSGPQTQWLWLLDAAGNKQKEIDLASLSPQPLVDVKDIVVRPNGSLLLIGEANAGLFLLIGYDPAQNQRVLARELSRAGQRYFINRFVTLGDDRYVTVGRVGTTGLAMAVRGDGDPLWEKIFSSEKVTVLSDGARLNSGEIVLVGSFLDPAGTTSIWTAALKDNGDFIASTSFPGRFTMGARAPEGQYAVLHDARGSAAWDVWLHGLTAELHEAWKVQLLSDPLIMFPFRAAQIRGGELIVVGSKDSHLWVARIGDQGKVRWSVSVKDDSAKQENVWNYGVLAAGDSFVVPYSTMVVNDKLEQRQELRVVKAQVGGS